MKAQTRKIAFLGILTTLALVLSYVEAILPPLYSAIPGIKMGLPNIIIIFMLYKFGLKEIAVVSLIRVCIATMLFGNFMMFAYSLAGAVLSLLIMVALKKTDRFSTVGVSIAGGVFHNLGQVLVAMLLLDSTQIGYYMLVLAITGTIAGGFIGFAGAYVLKRTEKFKI